MIVAVIDGMGGGIGAQIVTQLRQELPLDVEILALGTNAVATDRMMKARASRGASGENAIRVSIGQADFILAPIAVVVPNSLMGEVTPIILGVSCFRHSSTVARLTAFHSSNSMA